MFISNSTVLIYCITSTLLFLWTRKLTSCCKIVNDKINISLPILDKRYNYYYAL